MKDIIKIIEIIKEVEELKTIDLIAINFITIYVDDKNILNINFGGSSKNAKYKIKDINIPDSLKNAILYMGKIQKLSVNSICNVDKYIQFTDSKQFKQIVSEKTKKYNINFSIINDRCLNTFISMFNNIDNTENKKIKINYDLNFEVKLHNNLYKDLMEYKEYNTPNITKLNSNHIYYTGHNYQEYFVKLSDISVFLKLKGSTQKGLTHIDAKVLKYNRFSKSFINFNPML